MADGAGRARGGFRDYRFDNADIVNLRRLAGRPSALVAELFRIVEGLNRRPVGSFANIAQLYDCFGIRASGPSSRAIGLLRDLFLDGVNRRLQEEVYRKHLRANPAPAGASHDQKIASLEATRADAQAIVDSYDWRWLAEWLQLERIGENANTCIRRLSNFAFPIQRVNFRFTYHCNIACRHCYNSSGPNLKALRIPLERMLAIVAQMPDVGIGHLNLTGGEPFLYRDHLVALIAAGRSAGLNGISIYTNGFWAANAERAAQTLQHLSDAGFMRGASDHLKVSTGVYHQEFVEFDRILILARGYHAMFGKPLPVDFEMPPGDGEVAGRAERQVRDAGLADMVDLSFRDVAPLGRARDLDGFEIHAIDTPCNVINQIVFDPDGSARPCCGLNNENRGVVIGQLRTDALRDLVKRMQNDPLLQFLARNPMSAIFDHIEKPRSTTGYSNHCDLCQDAIGDLADKESLQAKFFETQQFYPFWFALRDEAGPVDFPVGAPFDEIDRTGG